MSNVEQLVEAVLLMSALPDSAVSDTFFDVQTQKMQQIVDQVEGQLSVESSDTFTKTLNALYKAGGKKAFEQLFLAYINQGNLVDLRAQLAIMTELGYGKSPAQKEWMAVCDKVFSLLDNLQVHATQIFVYQQPYPKGVPDRGAVIARMRQNLGLSSELNVDALFFKLAPRGVAYFAVSHPEFYKQLSMKDVGSLIETEKVIKYALLEVFKRVRDARELAQQTSAEIYTGKDKGIEREDENKTDYNMLLESVISGKLQTGRTTTISQLGEANLANYVAMSLQAYSQGIVPGSISPAKISACQDMVSLIILQEQIRELSESQVQQVETLMTRDSNRVPIPGTGAPMTQNTPGVQTFTSQQMSSIKKKADIVEEQTRVLLKSFSGYSNSYRRNKDFEGAYLNAGSGNTLNEDMQLTSSGQILKLDPHEQEILTQSLSLALACIRTRFNATNKSTGEMVCQEDIDSLDMIIKLAGYIGEGSLKTLQDLAVAIQAGIAHGYNTTLQAAFSAGETALKEAIDVAFERGKVTAKAVPAMGHDLDQGTGKFYKAFFECACVSLANRNRLSREIHARQARRVTMQKAAGSTILAGGPISEDTQDLSVANVPMPPVDLEDQQQKNFEKSQVDTQKKSISVGITDL